MKIRQKDRVPRPDHLVIHRVVGKGFQARPVREILDPDINPDVTFEELLGEGRSIGIFPSVSLALR